ncbi:hypothetical protein SEA_ODESZA_65 [Gordonia Phage Odesza]|uniref:Uncharacterized protein n=4 Tax=Tanisvirus tanis TaxID=2844677 RepID=A0A7D5FLQ7_9CAUD|nr:hypothetical protein PBI_GRAVY_65 [Gordonia phage Gravy]AVO25398.1 hypothetical protein PBI_KERRY_65 [Gordonia phage Kerry]QGJ89676.1 hypothetical protein SEA_ODESZA_65 [Gordonia Phage Odesza]QKY78737.1 hypothetical protein SEA_GILL_66 [Gordonia phage Gill]QLF83783.1 hypothetical protein SEA_MAGEL_67 [Gordonia phage Magel]QYW00705.1 hypothetical protein SEA_RONEY_66 [Gordonia phage Roney]
MDDSELDKTISHHPAGTKRRHPNIPTLEEIAEKRRVAANQKQIVLARQANALKLYKVLSRRLEVFREHEELLDELELTVRQINDAEERINDSEPNG